MTAYISPQPILQFFDLNGDPLSGGKIYTYVAGTTTPLVTYTDSTGLVANSNPVILNSRGEASVWLGDASYKFKLTTATDVEIWTIDNLSGPGAFSGPNGSSFIGYTQGSANAVARTVESRLRDFVSVKDFGAIGDGSADDTIAVTNAINYIASLGSGTARQDGGTVYFPNGSYKLTSEITMPAGRVNIVGSGRKTVYPGAFVPSATSPATIFGVHGSRNLFKIYNTSIVAPSFTFRDINVATLETGSRPTAAFGFDASGAFQRDFTFERVGVFGFTSGFDVYRSGVPNNAVGVIKIVDCAINRNTWIARNLNNAQWNSFKFLRNEAGQNGTVSNGGGGLDLLGQSITIQDNLMEGQANTIKVTGNYRGLLITGNYFEANSGDYIIRLSSVNGGVIESNFFGTVLASDAIHIIYGANVRVNEVDVVPSMEGSFNVDARNNAITYHYNASTTPVLDQTYAAVAQIYDPSSSQSVFSSGSTELGANAVGTSAKWMNSIFDSAGNLYTTSGTGLTTVSEATLPYTIPSGNYVAASVLISYDSQPALPPRIGLRLNYGTGGIDGDYTAIFYDYFLVQPQLNDKTILYYVVVKAKANITQLQTLMYPYGLSPVAGLNCTISAVAFYDLGATPPGKYRPEFIPFSTPRQVMATGFPLSNIWNVGQKVWKYNPLSGDYVGWTCVRNLATTLSVAALSGATAIVVVTATAANGDVVGVVQDNGVILWGTVTAGGGTTNLTISNPLTANAALGNTVYLIRWKGFGLVA